MKKITKNISKIHYLAAILLLLVGFALGFLANDLAIRKAASSEEIEKARNDIAAFYAGKTVKACWEVNDGANLAAEKYELTYRNLRINKYANRAIVSDCSDSDLLLFKNKSGQWIQSAVNLNIGNRANPIWQKACGIEDITVTDEVARPENGYIDGMNLEECRWLSSQ